MESYCYGKSLLFVGCQYGALDGHFTSYYELYPHLRHFILLRDAEIDELLNHEMYGALFIEYIGRGILNVIRYGEQYHELGPFLWQIVLDQGVELVPLDTQPHLYFDNVEQRIDLIFNNNHNHRWTTVRTQYP